MKFDHIIGCTVFKKRTPGKQCQFHVRIEFLKSQFTYIYGGKLQICARIDISNLSIHRYIGLGKNISIRKYVFNISLHYNNLAV